MEQSYYYTRCNIECNIGNTFADLASKLEFQMMLKSLCLTIN